jgi:hypothetical protein
MLDRFRCDGPDHGESCPQWCDLRPGGATKPPPYAAKATTLIQGTHAFRQGLLATGVCTCGQPKFSRMHSDYASEG